MPTLTHAMLLLASATGWLLVSPAARGAGAPPPVATANTYYLTGVPNAGAFAFTEGTKVSVLQALIAARFDVDAGRDKTVRLIRRDASGKESVREFRVAYLIDKRDDPNADTLLQGGDVLMVRSSAEAKPADQAPPRPKPAGGLQPVLEPLGDALKEGRLEDAREAANRATTAIGEIHKLGPDASPDERRVHAKETAFREGLRRVKLALDAGDLPTAREIALGGFNAGPNDRPTPEDMAHIQAAQGLTKNIVQRNDKALRQRTLDEVLARLKGNDANEIGTALAVLPGVRELPFDRAPFLARARELFAHDDAGVRAGAVTAVGLLGGDKTDVPRLAALAKDRAPAVRARVASALYAVAGEQPGADVLGAVDVLLDDYSANVQLQTIRSLWGRPVSPASEATLIALSRGSTAGGPGALAYDAVYYALSTRPLVSPAVADRLIEIVAGGEGAGCDPGRASWGLSHHTVAPEARERVTRAFIAELGETLNPYVRSNIVYGLGALGGEDAIAKLKELAEKDENERVRQEAAQALQRATRG